MNLRAFSFERVHYNVEGKKPKVTKYALKYMEKIGKKDIFLCVPWPLKMADQFSSKNILIVQTPEEKTAHYLHHIFDF